MNPWTRKRDRQIRRPYHGAVSSALLLTLILLGTLSTTTEPPAEARPLPLSAQLIGVATVATQFTGWNMRREVSAVAGTGANAIRLGANWNLIQPAQEGSMRFESTDELVSQAELAGLRILLTIDGSAPQWAQQRGADPTRSGNGPARAEDFGAFAETVARRYDGRVSAFEIWNEPNTTRFLIPPTAEAYLPLLQHGFLGVRRAGSKAPVLTGGTSSVIGETPDISFIQSLYALGAGPYFDGIAVHPYPFPDRLEFDRGAGAIVGAARKVMVEHGDTSKKVWITEFGQATGAAPEATTEAIQAEIIVDAIGRSREVEWIGGFFVFTTADLAYNSAHLDDNFGLYRYDFSPKPVVHAMRSTLAQ